MMLPRKPLLLAAGLVLALAAVPAATPVSGQTGTVKACKNPLAIGRAKCKAGQLRAALPYLEEAVAQAPASCEAQLALGETCLKLKDFGKARKHLRSAVRVGKGSANAQKANQLLMHLPAQMIAPKTGEGTRMIALALGLLSTDRGADGAPRPTVLDFYASWCEPCKQLKPLIEKARAQYGDKVNFVQINVDDPGNEQVIDQYGVSPIPTLVFLSSNGEVVTYTIGFAGEHQVEGGLKKILAGT